MNIRSIALFVIAFIPLVVLGQQGEYVTSGGVKFLLYTPPSYATGTGTHPMLVSLHGRGEIGTDLTKLTIGNPTEMPSRLIYLNKWPSSYPFIVVTPQYNAPNPTDPHPVWPVSQIDEVIEWVKARYRVDTTRLYMTGLSMGGFATWNYTSTYPNKVAAIIPMSPRNNMANACVIRNVPSWVFHGDSDPTVNYMYSVDIVNAINNCQSSSKFKSKLTVLHTRAHNGWTELYNGTSGYKIYDWLLKFRKGSSENVAPYVNAGPDLTFKLRSAPITIMGDAFDSDGTATIRWRQTAGTRLILADTLTEALQITTPLAGTFEFELSATDNSGASVSDRVIVKILSSSTLPVVNDLILVNGETDANVQSITQGMVLDKNLMKLSQINIRGAASTNTHYIRYTINTNRRVRIAFAPFFLRTQSTTVEWDVPPGDYVITATPYNPSGVEGLTLSFKIKVINGVPASDCPGGGKIVREVWAGVTGSLVSSIPVNSPPTTLTDLYFFESPTNVGDNYGARIRGYLCPPATGNYTFWIASDDRSQLWLSTSDDPTKKVKIAEVNGTTGIRQWTKYTTQKSALISLVAGTKYYVEALHKESTGTDHLSVGWQLPDGTLQRPISALNMIAFGSLLASPPEQKPEEPVKPEEPKVDLDVPFEASELDIYPNPFKRSDGSLKISLPNFGQRSNSMKIDIISITGRSVLSREIPCFEACDGSLLEFDHELTPGIYLVYVTKGTDQFMKRIVVR